TALDSLSEILALADALKVAPSEIVKLPVPAPGNSGTDAAINDVRLAVLAVIRDRPNGQRQPVEGLRARVAATVNAYCGRDRNGAVGAALPTLIRDLHTSIAAGRDVAELLELDANSEKLVAPDPVSPRSCGDSPGCGAVQVVFCRLPERSDAASMTSSRGWGGEAHAPGRLSRSWRGWPVVTRRSRSQRSWAWCQACSATSSR